MERAILFLGKRVVLFRESECDSEFFTGKLLHVSQFYITLQLDGKHKGKTLLASIEELPNMFDLNTGQFLGSTY